MRVSTGAWCRARMATPFQERSPCQTASYPRVRRAFTGKAPCSALSSWRLTTSGSAFASHAKRLSSRLLMLLMLKVATFTKTLSVPVLLGAPKRNKRVRYVSAEPETLIPAKPTLTLQLFYNHFLSVDLMPLDGRVVKGSTARQNISADVLYRVEAASFLRRSKK